MTPGPATSTTPQSTRLVVQDVEAHAAGSQGPTIPERSMSAANTSPSEKGDISPSSTPNLSAKYALNKISFTTWNGAVRAVCFDGGSTGTISQLRLLRETMKRIQASLGLSRTPLPCQCFEIFGGSGSGGFLAIVFGRLCMSVEEAEAYYVSIMKAVYAKGRRLVDGKLNAATLERLLKEMIEKKTGNPDEPLLDQALISRGVVFCRSAHNMSAGITRALRSYPVLKNESPPCTIWQALRATLAAANVFESIAIGDPSLAESYLDGDLGQKNPITALLEEIELVFPDSYLSCILSFGSGQLRPIQMARPIFNPSLRGGMFSDDLARAALEIATDPEKASEEAEKRFKNAPNVLFRFNVEQGMQDLAAYDWDKLGEVLAHTHGYIKLAKVDAKLDKAVQTLLQGAENVRTSLLVSIPLSSGAIIQLKICPSPIDAFHGRIEILVRLEDFYFDGALKRHTFILAGMGGVGKTQIARKFIATCQTRPAGDPKRFSAVFMVDASNRETITTDLKSIALAQKAGDTYQDALRWFCTTTEPWLLYLDNADDPDLPLHEFIPQCSHGNILITTRNQALKVLAPEFFVNVDPLPTSEAVALLLSLANPASGEDLALQIVEELGCLPLAIVQAGSFISRTGYTLARYQEIYKKRQVKLFDESKRHIQPVDDYHRTVFTTWALSYERLDPPARTFLDFCSVFHHHRIPQFVFEVAAQQIRDYVLLEDSEAKYVAHCKAWLDKCRTDGEWDDIAFGQIVADLRGYSLIHSETDGLEQFFSIHSLVANWTRTIQSDLAETNALAQLLLSIAAEYPKRLTDHTYSRILSPHILSTLRVGKPPDAAQAHSMARTLRRGGHYQHAGDLLSVALERFCVKNGQEGERTLGCMEDLAITHLELGAYGEAKALYVRVLDARKRLLGPDDPSTLTTMHNLAVAHATLGAYEDAKDLYIRVLDSQTRLHRAEDPSALATMHELAQAHSHLGAYDEAKTLYVKVLDAETRLLGRDHPSTLTTMHNLAHALCQLGAHDEARVFYVKALEAETRLLGAKHPSTLLTMHNIAHLHSSLGQYEEAKTLYVEVFQAQNQLLGPEHPSTLITMHNLARAHDHLGAYDDAKTLYQKVLEVETRSLGLEHASTLTTMHNLARLHCQLGDFEDAKTMYSQILDAETRSLGVEHSSTLATMHNLGGVHSQLGEYEDAKALYIKELEAETHVLGAEHPSTLDTMRNLADAYSCLGTYHDAEALLVKVLEAETRLLGADHASTLTTMSNLAGVYFDLGGYEAAKALYIKVLAVRTRLLDPEHPSTLTTMNNLAVTYSHLGSYKDARDLYLKVLDAHSRLLGSEHPYTLTTMHNLAQTHSRLGAYEDARDLLLKVVGSRMRHLGPEHPSTLTSVHSLAQTHVHLGAYEDAKALCIEVVNVQTRLLRAQHPLTFNTMHTLAQAYFNLGAYDDAKALFVNVLEEQSQMFGDEHPSTLMTMHGLAMARSDLGAHEDAKAILIDAVEAHSRLLGKEHPDTLTLMHGLAQTNVKLREYETARTMHMTVLNARKRVLGGDHSATLVSMRDTAVVLLALRSHSQAEALLREALVAMKRVLPPDHPDTSTCMHHLADAVARNGRPVETLQLANEALNARRRILGAQHSHTLESELFFNQLQTKIDRLEATHRRYINWPCVVVVPVIVLLFALAFVVYPPPKPVERFLAFPYRNLV